MKNLKKIALMLLVITLIFSCGNSEAKKIKERAEEYQTKYSDLEDGLYAVIVTEKGDIVSKLYYKEVPMTVTNFVGLAEGTIKNSVKNKKAFYDGLLFHRVVDNFVIQGGDPRGTGEGGPGYKFNDEFNINLKHTEAGILSMANSGKNTNGSQFFITLSAAPHLDFKHSVFGKVVQGLDVIKSIAVDDKIVAVVILRVGEDAKTFFATDKTFEELKKTNIKRVIAFKRDQAKAEKEAFEKLVSEKYPNAITTASGLKYIVTKKGSGEKPARGTKVKAHYTGTLLNGSKFDSSVDRGTPFVFSVGQGQVIKGWDEAFLDMRKGEKRILIIPANLGYGSRASGSIPPNSTLIFDVELIDF